jgi:hypothetical protein
MRAEEERGEVKEEERSEVESGTERRHSLGTCGS